jgi:hypothetical protein
MDGAIVPYTQPDAACPRRGPRVVDLTTGEELEVVSPSVPPSQSRAGWRDARERPFAARDGQGSPSGLPVSPQMEAALAQFAEARVRNEGAKQELAEARGDAEALLAQTAAECAAIRAQAEATEERARLAEVRTAQHRAEMGAHQTRGSKCPVA